MKSGLLEEVVEQNDKANVFFDADSLIFLSCYRFKDTKDIELMYVDFWMRIKHIEATLWESYEIDEVVIGLTTSKSFRNDLTTKWKANRKAKPEKELTDKQLQAQRDSLELKGLVKQVKVLLNKRMSSSSSYSVFANSIEEADDRAVALSHKGWLIISQDSDVIKQSATPVFNYHKKHYKWEEPNTYEGVCRHILIESIAGTHNGAGFGVVGIGLVKATKLIDDGITFDEFVNLFPTPEEMLMNVRVISCNQVTDGKLNLLGVEDIAEMINEVKDSGEDVF